MMMVMMVMIVMMMTVMYHDDWLLSFVRWTPIFFTEMKQHFDAEVKKLRSDHELTMYYLKQDHETQIKRKERAIETVSYFNGIKKLTAEDKFKMIKSREMLLRKK